MIRRFAAAMVGLCVLAATGCAQPPPALEITLAPRPEGTRIGHVDISITLRDFDAVAGGGHIIPPQSMPDIEGDPYDAQSLAISDDSGPVPFSIGDDRRIGFERDTRGDVILRYRAPAHVVTRTVFPPYELRAENRSMMGAGMAFLMSPADDRRYRIRLQWDLSALPDDSIGVWSFGEGTVERTGTGDDLRNSFLGAGPLMHHVDGSFGLYWASEPPFDLAPVGASLGKLYRYYVGFFGHDPGSFRAFLRRNEQDGGGAGALAQSFLFDYGPGIDRSRMMDVLPHEMVHPFLGSWPDGRWYDEGTANRYAAVLSVRAGISSPDDFIRVVNADATAYYASPVRNFSQFEAEAMEFGSDGAVDALFYSRSHIHLAALNARIVQASGGRRSLDDVTLALLADEDAGAPGWQQTWLRLIAAELGPEGLEAHEDFLGGKLIVPPADAFGPCFTRERHDLPVYSLGFDRRLLQSQPAFVSGLEPDSPAAAAGLRNGDEILSSNLYRSFTDPTREAQLTIRRGRETIELSFIPRTDTMQEAYRWWRVPGVPDADCRI